jgi:dCMP deaminase
MTENDSLKELLTAKDIMQIVWDETSPTYECNRGPRPSGAMIVTANKTPILGRVKPCCEGAPNCIDDGCMMRHDHCVRNLHAEVDAIMSAVKIGLGVRDGTIFSINKPCYNCTMHIIAAGITTIYYAYTVYDDIRTSDILKVARIKCEHVPIN